LTIYKRPNKRPTNNLHRTTWEQTNGEIPLDDNGRKYDIHHIDGNPHNNNISNLQAVSIQEHYDIHISQGDWAAALLIAQRLSKTPEELSVLSSSAQKKRILDGNHHFADSNWQRQNQLNRVANGSHQFIGGKIQGLASQNRVNAGTHNFQGDNSPSRRMVADGTSHLLGNRNPSKVQFTCPHCNKTGGGKSAMYRYHFDNCKFKLNL
jgi:hypothetical protein